MRSLRIFITDFLKNKGHHVFLSLLIAKICGFLGSLFIIRILPETEFGQVSIVASVFFIFLSFGGFGSYQSLLRYGSVTQSFAEKLALSKYLLKKGIINQVFLSFAFLLVSVFYVNKSEEIFYIFFLFTIRLIGYYFLNHIQAEFRIVGNNKAFARVSNVVNISSVIFLLILSYFFGLVGYLYAIAFSPFIALFWYTKQHFVRSISNFNFTKKEIWNFGLHAAVTALLSDALFSADVLMLSFLMNESSVANYKVALLIPANITFFATTFLQSDYTILARNSKNKFYLKNYIFNYYKIFVPISLIIFAVGYLFNSEILHLSFGEKYAKNELIFLICLGGFSLNILFKNLYEHLFSAVGMMNYDTYVSFLNLILLLIFSAIFVNLFGIVGMAMSLCLSMLVGGLVLLFSFYFYWKDLK